MRPLTAGELTSLRSAYDGTLLDTCQLLSWGGTARDDHNQPAPAWQLLLTTSCGFQSGATGEVLDGTEVVTVDATLRLPLALEGSLGSRDRVRVTHRHGEVLAAPLTFSIVGEPLRGPAGLVVHLQRVTEA